QLSPGVGALKAFDLATFATLRTLPIPVVSALSLTRWGEEGLAVHSDTGEVFLVEWNPRQPAAILEQTVFVGDGQVVQNVNFGDQLVAPVAVADGASTSEDVALDIAAPGLLTNDTVAGTGAVKTVVAINGQGGTVGTQIALASGALLTVRADGSFRYDPNGQ